MAFGKGEGLDRGPGSVDFSPGGNTAGSGVRTDTGMETEHSREALPGVQLVSGERATNP
jgi:hypothetical protein